jgi:hypothetical protein
MDIKNRITGEGVIADIAEVIAQENPILDDIPWKAGNLITGNVIFRRSSMPKAVVRKINEGVEASKSTTTPDTDTCIELYARGEIDMTALDIQENPAAYLVSENKAHIASLGETCVEQFLYGNPDDGLIGISNRYGKLNNSVTGSQIIDFGGTKADGDLQSIYIVKWDPNEVSGLYPKNTSAGLKIVSKSNERVKDRNGKEFLAHTTDYKWFVGLMVRDYRYIARLCNIPTVVKNETLDIIFRKLIICKNRIYNVDKGKVVIYMSPDLYDLVEIAADEKKNMSLGYKDLENNVRLLHYKSIPIRKNDCQKIPEEQLLE